MISKYLLLIIILILFEKISTFIPKRQSHVTSRSLVDQLSTGSLEHTNRNVNRIYHKNGQQITDSPSYFDRQSSHRLTYSTGVNSIVQRNTSKVQILESKNESKKSPIILSQYYCPSNCTCLSLINFKSRHNDSELYLTNHCLYLNLSSTDKEQFRLYEQFHPFQLHQLNELNLNHNNLTSLNDLVLNNTGHNQTIEKLRLSHNHLNKFPRFKDLKNSLKYLYLDHNKIVYLTGDKSAYKSLISLNLNHNRIRNVRQNFFRQICDQMRYVDLSSNRLTRLDDHLFVKCEQLESLKLNRNRLRSIGANTFDNLTKLVELDLSQNNLTSLTIDFRSLKELKLLNLNKNNLESIDGSTFQYLANLQTLNLNENNLIYLDTNSMRGLSNLRLLQLSNNRLNQIDVDWLENGNLVNLYLERNRIEQINSRTFAGLTNLKKLYLDYNLISSIESNAFQTNPNLIWLFLNDNYLNKLVEMNRTLFIHNTLQYLALENNHLTYIPNQLFTNLTSLVTIDLSLNQLKYIEENALEPLLKLDELNFDSINLDCDCGMKWFVNYYQEKSIENIYLEQLECKTPKSLTGKAFIDVNINLFLCKDDFRHYFLKEPKRQQTINQGQKFELRCKVVTNSFLNEDIIFEWRKNNQTLQLGNERNIVEIMKLNKDKDHSINHKLIYSSYLRFLNASNKDTGQYECLANNSYSSIRSQPAQVMISKPPQFETPDNHLKVQLGGNIQIDCKTTNDPLPEISLNKNGQNFTSSIKHRILFDRSKQQFTIKNATLDDKGLFTCIAINKLGRETKNITVDILYAPYFEAPVQMNDDFEYFDEGETIFINCSARSNPMTENNFVEQIDRELASNQTDFTILFSATNPKAIVMLYKDKKILEADLNDRYYLKSDSQILIIKNSRPSDSGLYRCILKNELGIVKLIRKVEILTSEQAKLNYLYNNWYLVLLLFVIVVCSICLLKIICVFVCKRSFRLMFKSNKKVNESTEPIKILNNGQIDTNFYRAEIDRNLPEQNATLLSKENDFSSKYRIRNSPKNDPDYVTALIGYKKAVRFDGNNSSHQITMPECGPVAMDK